MKATTGLLLTWIGGGMAIVGALAVIPLLFIFGLPLFFVGAFGVLFGRYEP
tara:strand:+ start:4465 stop:4617 length:153 start_codon:yes stop_codon:yes gene_type:complete